MRRANSTADQTAATIIASIAAKRETGQQSTTYEIATPHLSSCSIEKHTETQKGLWLCSAAPKTKVSISVDGKELATIVPKMITATSRKAKIVDAEYYQEAITSAMDKFNAVDKPIVEEVTILRPAAAPGEVVLHEAGLGEAESGEASATSQADDVADQAMEEGVDVLGFITASSGALSRGEANESRPATASSGTNASQEVGMSAAAGEAAPGEASATSQINSKTDETSDSSSGILVDSDSSSDSDAPVSSTHSPEKQVAHTQPRKRGTVAKPRKELKQQPESTESAALKEAKEYVASLLKGMNDKAKGEELEKEKARVVQGITARLLQIEAELKELSSLQHKIQKPLVALIRSKNLDETKARIEGGSATKDISLPSAPLLYKTTATARAKTEAVTKALISPLTHLIQLVEHLKYLSEVQRFGFLNEAEMDRLRTTLLQIREKIKLSLEIINEASGHLRKSALATAFADQLRHFPPQPTPPQVSGEVEGIIAKELELMAVEQYLSGEIAKLHNRDVPGEKDDTLTRDRAQTGKLGKASAPSHYQFQRRDLDSPRASRRDQMHSKIPVIPLPLGQVRAELKGAEDKKGYMISKKGEINHALEMLGGIPPSMPYAIRQESKRTANGSSILKQLQAITKHLELLTIIRRKRKYPDFNEVHVGELRNALNLMGKGVDKLMSMVTLKKDATHPLLASAYARQRYVAAAPAIPQTSCPHWNDDKAVDEGSPTREQESVPTLIPMDQQYNTESSLKAAGRYLDRQLAEARIAKTTAH